MNRLLPNLILVFLITACSHKPSITDQEISKTVLESLNSSSKTISSNSYLILHTFEQDLSDPHKHNGAMEWQPKAAAIHNFTSIVNKQIDTLINRLNEEVQEGKKDNSVYQLFIEKGNATLLYNSIHSYIKQVMNIDPKIQNQFQSHLDLLPNGFDSSNSRATEFGQTFFEHSDPNHAILMLTGLKNRIIVAENKLLTFCHEVFPRGIGFFFEPYTYSAIVSQNTKYLKGDDTLTILAGIGSFIKNHNQKVFIAGNSIPIDEIGVANYSTRVTDKIGSHSIPVRIEYTDQDGKIQYIDKLVKYLVIGNK